MSSSSMSKIVDDRDPTISYTGTWLTGGTLSENDNTVTFTWTAGSSFSLPFSGTNIAVYGTFDAMSAGVQTSYAIDGGDAAPFTFAAPQNNAHYKELFWQSNTLPSGSQCVFRPFVCA
ncbi:hypothetical protein B0H13DRAFT_2402354 [Mycena leptocephala]|nr:hypothetical protein B0H13DRAFT_2402354 [Mycena leptocephala]